MKKIIPLIIVLTVNLYPQITDITRLPVQDSSRIYLESTPVVISENEILVFFLTRQTDYNSSIADTLFCSRSTDRGSTWQEKQFIFEFKASYTSVASQLATIRTETGRIIIAFTDRGEKKIGVIHSDDDGISWSGVVHLEGGGSSILIKQNSIYNLILSQVTDQRIILSFSSLSSYSTTYFRESLDSGETWSDSAYTYHSESNVLKDLSFVSAGSEKIISFFLLPGAGLDGLYKETSTDGGLTWTEAQEITEPGININRARVIKVSNENIWIAYQKMDTVAAQEYCNDLYFIKSADAGETWENPVRFTYYIGKDDLVNSAPLGNKPFITFSSTRFTNEPQISFGILGETTEIFRPPYILNYLTSHDSINSKVWSFRCEIIDDQQVARAFFEPDAGIDIELFDDGNHNDEEPSDNIFGNSISLENFPPTGDGIMDVNKIEIPFDNKGAIAEISPTFELNSGIKAIDNDDQQVIDKIQLTLNYYTARQYDESSFLFAGGFLLSGYTNGELWANAVMTAALVNDYLPGKQGSDQNNPLNKIYTVKKEDAPFGYSWQKWRDAVSLGAEFYDGDKDGVYNPIDKNYNGTWDRNEDMPFLIGDKTAWCVYNDGVPGAMRRWPDMIPEGIEIRQTIFASGLQELENVIFLRYSILNTGTATDLMDSVYFGIWEDPDLGEFYDDFIGCDTVLNSGFVYNNGEDMSYGLNPPSFFTTILQGPVIQTGIAEDTAYNNSGTLLGGVYFPGSQNLDMTAHVFFVGGDPFMLEPYNAEEARNYLLGRNRFGYYVNPCDTNYWRVGGGVNCNEINPVYWLSGDPVSEYGWISKISVDYKNLISVGPFNLEKSKPQDIIIAYVLGRGNDPINSITIARQNVERAIQEYKSNFASMTYAAPAATNPVVNYQLYQNYPNPFNPVTTIRYELPQDGIVTIEIFDILGQRVQTLVNEFQKADRYEVKFDGSALASGIYIYSIKVNNFITNKKMVLLK